VGEPLARLVLLALFGAVMVNLSRGTLRAWLRAKFIGDTSSTSKPIPRVPASSPLARQSVPGGRGGV